MELSECKFWRGINVLGESQVGESHRVESKIRQVVGRPALSQFRVWPAPAMEAHLPAGAANVFTCYTNLNTRGGQYPVLLSPSSIASIL